MLTKNINNNNFHQKLKNLTSIQFNFVCTYVSGKKRDMCVCVCVNRCVKRRWKINKNNISFLVANRLSDFSMTTALMKLIIFSFWLLWLSLYIFDDIVFLLPFQFHCWRVGTQTFSTNLNSETCRTFQNLTVTFNNMIMVIIFSCCKDFLPYKNVRTRTVNFFKFLFFYKRKNKSEK